MTARQHEFHSRSCFGQPPHASASQCPLARASAAEMRSPEQVTSVENLLPSNFMAVSESDMPSISWKWETWICASGKLGKLRFLQQVNLMPFRPRVLWTRSSGLMSTTRPASSICRGSFVKLTCSSIYNPSFNTEKWEVKKSKLLQEPFIVLSFSGPWWLHAETTDWWNCHRGHRSHIGRAFLLPLGVGLKVNLIFWHIMSWMILQPFGQSC